MPGGLTRILDRAKGEASAWQRPWVAGRIREGERRGARVCSSMGVRTQNERRRSEVSRAAAEFLYSRKPSRIRAAFSTCRYCPHPCLRSDHPTETPLLVGRAE